MTELWEDLRYGLRLIRRSPGSSAAAILALALGIGANAAIFSVVGAVLLAPLPYGDPDRIMMIWEDASHIGFPRNTPAPANWMDWRKQNTVFTDIAASRGWSYSLTGDGPPEQIPARRVTANLWTILDAKPVIGRVFTEEEDRTGASVAVIGYGLWQRRFGGDSSILGRKILLNDTPFTVVGVMPQRFSYPSRSFELWTPASFTPNELARRGSHFLQCVARLKPGVTLQQAHTEMNVIAKRLEQEHPVENRNLGAVVVPMNEQVVGNTRAILIALLAAAGCVLLIACANIANLLLARGTERQREMAVRAAIGAGGARLVRQLLTESLMLAGFGAVAGLGVARLGMSVMEKLVPYAMASVELGLDARLLGLAIGLAILTGLLFGAVPAITGARTDLQSALKQGGRGSAGRSSGLLRDVLVVAQVSLALVLLTGAGLMIQTLYRLRSVDIGIRTDHVLTVVTRPSPTRYQDHSRRVAFINGILDKVRALPGVEGAGYTSNLPLTTTGNTSGYIIRGQTGQQAQGQDALFRVVTSEFLGVIGATLREGRGFSDSDRADTQPVLIVNETFANRHWPRESALGKGIQINHRGPNDPWLMIVGVVKEIRERGIEPDLKPAIYMPHAQSANEWPIPSDLAVRTKVDPESLTNAIRQAVWAVDKDQPLSRVRTMDELATGELTTRSQPMVLLAIFAGLALVLASIGIYGVLSFLVSQRAREIAVRMAMGAQPGQVLRMVAGRGLGLACAGLAIGTGVSLGVSRLIRNLLYGVSPRDPWTLGSVSLVLLLVSLTACVIPARRAARIDPASALRND